MTFDGSTIEGYSRIQESDMLAKPDPNTFELLPGGDVDAASRADVLRHRRSSRASPFHGDPRYVLKRNLERAREKGFTFFVGPEMEFFYFRTGGAGRAARQRRATSTSPRTTSVLSCASRPCCGSRRWASRSSTRSTRTGRASTRSTSATPTRSTMADNVMTFRLITKEVAADNGVYATFMPKPIAGAFGSGMHSHLSLFEGDVNAFHDPGDEYGLSKVAKHFIAGLLVHASEIVADHEPVGQLVQAADPRLRGAGLQVLGAQQSFRARAGAAVEDGQERVDAHRVPRPRSRRATRTSRSR